MSVMQTDLKYCSECHGPLIEIDYYGLRLIGCIECNCWGWQAASHGGGRRRYGRIEGARQTG